MAQTAFSQRNALLALGIALCVPAAVKMLPAQTNQTQPPVTGKRQGAPAEATPAAAKRPYDEMEFKMHARTDSVTNTTVGDDFVYTRGDSVTTGDHGRYKELDTKTHKGILDANGNLVYDDPKHHATCNKAHIDTTIRLAVFTENVVLVLKPDPEAAAPAPPANGAQPATATPVNGAPAAQPENGAASDVRGQKKHGATVYCDRMEDQYRKKYIKLYGHVVFKQKLVDADGKTVERELTAEHAEYNGKSEVMVLFGPVDGHDSNGQEFHTLNNMNINTKEGEEALEGTGIKTRFLPQDDNEDDSTEPEAGGNTKPATDTKATDTTKEKDGKPAAAKGKQ